jgi:hypothetical protein
MSSVDLDDQLARFEAELAELEAAGAAAGADGGDAEEGAAQPQPLLPPPEAAPKPKPVAAVITRAAVTQPQGPSAAPTGEEVWSPGGWGAQPFYPPQQVSLLFRARGTAAATARGRAAT